MAANNLGTAYIRIAPQMEGIQSAISSQLQKATSSTKISTSSIALGTVISKGISTAMGAITSSLDDAVKRTDILNNFPRVMKNLGIGAEDAQKSIERLSQGLDGLPTSLQDAASAVQRFTSKNNDVKKSTDIFLALNNAILAGGASAEIQATALEQISQAYAKGKPDMMEWRTMLTAMPAQLNQVAKSMGLGENAADKLGEALRKGEISMDDFLNEIIKLNGKGVSGLANFEEQARDATAGIGTAMTNLKNRIAKALSSIIQAFGAKDISDAINQFSSSFGMIGDWIAKNVVPVIKNTIIPALKNLLNVIKGVFEFIASHKDIQQIIMGLVNAFIAFKTLKFVGGILSSITTGIKSIVSAASNGIKGVKSFAEAMHSGFNLGDSLKYASLQTTGLTSNITKLGSSAVTTAGSFSALGAGILAVEAVTAAVVGFQMAMTATETAAIAARTRTREYERAIYDTTDAQRALNNALGLEPQLIQDITDAMDAQDKAELSYLESKKYAAQLENEYNELKRTGTATADDLREAELKLSAAKKDASAKQKEYNEAIKTANDSLERYIDNQLTSINETNKVRIQQELAAGNYGLVATQIDALSNATIRYIDENGNMATATKEKSEELANYMSSAAAEMSSTWKQIYDLSVSEGISLIEACTRIGADSSKNLAGNFNIGMQMQTPLMTDAAANSLQSVKDTMDAKASESKDTGKKIANEVVSGITDGTPSITAKGKDAVNVTINGMKTETKSSNDVGKQLANGATSGLESGQGSFWAKCRQFVKTGISKMRAEAIINSPSKKTAEIGKFMSMGLAKGIEDYADEAVSAAESVTDATLGAFNGGDGFGINSASATPYSAASGLLGGNSVTQYNTFNQVDTNLDMNEISKRLGWQVSVAL